MAKNTDIKQRYRKQRKRIQAYIRNYTSMGYQFKDFTMPKIPKKITEASIRRLEKITSDKLKLKREFLDLRTGEILRGKKLINFEKENRPYLREIRELVKEYWEDFEKQERDKGRGEQKGEGGGGGGIEEEEDIPEYYDTVIEGLKSQMLEYPERLAKLFIHAVDDIIKEYGKKKFVDALQNMNYQWYEYMTVLHYPSGEAVEAYSSDIISLIPFVSDEQKAELEKAFNEESWSG